MRKPLPRPTRRKDIEIVELERKILGDVERLVSISTDVRFTFFMNNLTARLRNQGALLPGDGKGGYLLPPKDQK